MTPGKRPVSWWTPNRPSTSWCSRSWRRGRTSRGGGSAVLLTRPEGRADPLVGLLNEAGVRVYAVPTVAIEASGFEAPVWGAFDWVVVTSARGARALLDGSTDAPSALVRWAAVGPQTSAALESGGVRAAAVPERPLGVEVAAAIAAVQPLTGLRVLLARADAASADLPRVLGEAGAHVTELSVYHTLEGPEASRAPLNLALGDPGLRAVVFASGSAVRGLVRLADQDPRGFPAVTIGPATTSAARREGFHVAAEAVRPGPSELVAAVRSALLLAPGA